MSEPTVHLIYPTSDLVRTPFAIGRELSLRLRKRHQVIVHSDHRVEGTINPNPGDILIGVPDWNPRTIFRASLDNPNWSRRIAICPFNTDPRQVGHLESIIHKCDYLLAITATHWIKQAPLSCFRHWIPKIIHLDLAVNTNDFPRLKSNFSPIGKRKFLFIGNPTFFKNVSYLNDIAGSLPDMSFHWIGPGIKRYAHLKQFGRIEFGTNEARQKIHDYDFFITVGDADCNPTTILEAMAWGLIPICTPQSGYDEELGICNVPLNDIGGVQAILRKLQQCSEESLFNIQVHNWERLEKHYNWDRFAEQVEQVISSNKTIDDTQLLPCPFRDKLYIAWGRFRSPHTRWRTKIIVRKIRRALGDKILLLFRAKK